MPPTADRLDAAAFALYVIDVPNGTLETFSAPALGDRPPLRDMYLKRAGVVASILDAQDTVSAILNGVARPKFPQGGHLRNGRTEPMNVWWHDSPDPGDQGREVGVIFGSRELAVEVVAAFNAARAAGQP